MTELNVAFLAGDLSDGGGVNRVISELSALMAEQPGWEVKVLALGPKRKPRYPISGRVKVEQASDDRPIGWREALSRLRREKPAFVIGSWTQMNMVLILGLLFSGIRVVAVEHTNWNFHRKRIRALRRVIYPWAWRVIVLNPRELAYYRRFLRNALLFPNPVEAAPAMPTGGREKLVVAVGHLEDRKNFIDAIRAMALSRLEEDGWALAIIGNGPEEQRLRDAIAKLGLERTRLHPPTSDIASWYARASLMLVTSKLEVFSLVLAEAMLAGVVPVAYGADGPAFILENFPDHVVPVGAVEALAARLREFAQVGPADPLRSQLRETVGTRFSPERVVCMWRELLEGGAAG